MLIKLPNTTREIAKVIGTMRQLCCRDAGVRNQRIGPQSDDETDELGVLGEIAVARRLNVFPDLSVLPRSGGWDLVCCGKKLDVKSTKCETGHLLATIKSLTQPHADIYILVIIRSDTVDLRGWAYAEDLLDRSKLITLRGSSFGLPQSALRSPEELLSLLNLPHQSEQKTLL